jgi:hypothetical protein
MSIIQELTEKYNGIYSEDQTSSFSGPTGKYSYQQKSGIIDFDGTKISINLNEVGGAMYGTEPFRITLHLDKTYEVEFNVFPKTLWDRFLDYIIPNRAIFIPRTVRNQFSFGGNKDLIKKLVSDKILIENINNEKIFIGTINKPTDRIVLTPAHGINDVDHFEKFVKVLKRIENEIKNYT